jgi:hypothetical protein
MLRPAPHGRIDQTVRTVSGTLYTIDAHDSWPWTSPRAVDAGTEGDACRAVDQMSIVSLELLLSK